MANTETPASASSAGQAAPDQRYTVVARRYRPRSFDQLVGQQHVGQALVNAIETGRVGHAYLFTGARGVGKTSTARIFAKALNDPGGPTATPDGSTDVAQAIDAGEDVDVLEIDGASNRGIDEIRALRAGVGVRPSRSRYKIYIIDEVHMLTGAAFNALLKTLEEPPAHVKFIFCTTDPEKIPITVLSRCQRFDFAPVQTEAILGRLREIVDAEGMTADDDALRLIARRADGSMRDSQSLLEQVMSFSSGTLTTAVVHAMLGTADDARLHELAQALASGDAARTLQLVDQACGQGVAAGQLAEQLLGYLRDLMLVTVGCPPEMQRHAGESLHAELKTLGKHWGLQTVLAIVGLIDHALVRIRHSLHGRVLLESALVQVCHLPNLQTVADLAASLTDNNGTGTSKTLAVTRANDEKKKFDAALTASPHRPATPLPTGPDLSGPASHPPAVAARGSIQTPATSATLGPAPPAPPHANPATAAAVGPATAPVRPLEQPLATGTTVSATSAPQSSPAAIARFDPGSVKPGLAQRRPGHPVAAPAQPAKSRAQLMRQIEQDPYVQSCLEIFGGEVVKIDPPRSPVVKTPAGDD